MVSVISTILSLSDFIVGQDPARPFDGTMTRRIEADPRTTLGRAVCGLLKPGLPQEEPHHGLPGSESEGSIECLPFRTSGCRLLPGACLFDLSIYLSSTPYSVSPPAHLTPVTHSLSLTCLGKIHVHLLYRNPYIHTYIHLPCR